MPAYQQAVKLSPLATAQVPEALDDRRRGDLELSAVVQSLGMDDRARPVYDHICRILPARFQTRGQNRTVSPLKSLR